MPLFTAASSVYADMYSTGSRSQILEICSTSSRPFIPGITTSVSSRAMDVPSRVTISMASLALLASTTLYPLIVRKVHVILRTASSSSTTKIVSEPSSVAGTGSGVRTSSIGSSVRGKYMVIAVPKPGSLEIEIAPPLCSTIPYAVESPSPVPLLRSLVVKNGSKA